MIININRTDATIAVPRHAKRGDAGLDLSIVHDIDIRSGETVMVGTGIRFAIPTGYYGLLAPRSGFASKYGVTLANTPSIIDSGFRGEVMLALYRLPSISGDKPLHIAKGTRVAQMIVQRHETVECVEVGDLDSTDRGEGGFGSTGAAS